LSNTKPVPKVNRLYLIDIANKNKQLEARFLQYTSHIIIADCATLVNEENIASRIIVPLRKELCDRSILTIPGGNLPAHIIYSRMRIGEEYLILIRPEIRYMFNQRRFTSTSRAVNQCDMRIGKSLIFNRCS